MPPGSKVRALRNTARSPTSASHAACVPQAEYMKCAMTIHEFCALSSSAQKGRIVTVYSYAQSPSLVVQSVKFFDSIGYVLFYPVSK
jgi:hypothetical protein